MFTSSCSVELLDHGRAAPPGRAVRTARRTMCLGLASAVSLVALVLPATSLADGTVPLGTADSFAVLGGTAVTNTGPSLINGDLGVYPGTSVTGFSPLPTDGKVNGAIHATDATAQGARADITNAFGVAASQAPTGTLNTNLSGATLTAGVYKYDSTAGLTGTLTLDGQGRSDGVFIFQIGSALTTATDSHVNFINGAQPCHVFWQVGSTATLGTASVFVGNILASASITVGATVTVQGRLLAGTGNVTLIDDTVNRADCTTPTTPPSTTPGTPVTGGTPGTTTGTPTPVGSQNTSTAGKRRQAIAKARARAIAKAKAKAKARARKRAAARARALARARARAHHSSPSQLPTPTNSRSFTG